MTTLNDRTSAMSLLLSRRSAKARDLAEPGPSEIELRQILSAASRVPDHGKLSPWRFVVIGKENREAFAAGLVAALRAEKPDASEIEIEGALQFARQAPVIIAVLSRITKGIKIPEWEQELSAGAACQNLLMAAHALGYHANWLTGWATYSPAVIELLGGAPGDRSAGFVFIGTSTRPAEERPRPELEAISTIWSPRT
ncbi:MAG TPA: nitroreductase [Pedomonas sp.]|uniref:nitroreductase family protein n=1 Tax=Pedomonas sp. TaxID=2976421 RepID=UPI002F401C20